MQVQAHTCLAKKRRYTRKAGKAVAGTWDTREACQMGMHKASHRPGKQMHKNAHVQAPCHGRHGNAMPGGERWRRMDCSEEEEEEERVERKR